MAHHPQENNGKNSPKNKWLKCVIATVSVIALTACSTLPAASTLGAGLPDTVLSDNAEIDGKTVEKLTRSADDPICQTFYGNAKTYLAEAAKPNAGGQFLTQLGVSVLAGVVTNGLASGIGSTAGQIAVQQAANTAIYSGSGLVLKEPKPASKAAKTIQAKADELGCPVQIGS